MMDGKDESPGLDELRKQLDETRRQLEEERQRRRTAESSPGATDDARGPNRGSMDSSMEVAPINEADVTLRRLVQRIAMILQAEKIAIMFYDREKGELIGIPPSYGVEEEHLTHFR